MSSRCSSTRQALRRNRLWASGIEARQCDAAGRFLDFAVRLLAGGEFEGPVKPSQNAACWPTSICTGDQAAIAPSSASWVSNIDRLITSRLTGSEMASAFDFELRRAAGLADFVGRRAGFLRGGIGNSLLEGSKLLLARRATPRSGAALTYRRYAAGGKHQFRSLRRGATKPVTPVERGTPFAVPILMRGSGNG